MQICHPSKEFVDDLHSIALGEVYWLPPAYTGLLLLEKLRLLRSMRPAPASDERYCPLTSREQEVFRLIAVGLTNTNIAERLYVSVSTVKTHVAEIKRKLNATTRPDLVAAYYRPTRRT
jgi:DNA-binding NarL/FixJ family response regulator